MLPKSSTLPEIVLESDNYLVELDKQKLRNFMLIKEKKKLSKSYNLCFTVCKDL